MSAAMSARCNLLVRMGAMVVLAVALAPRAGAQDVGRGEDVFAAECAECHSVKAGRNKKGPSLFAIVGRRAGIVGDFAYSDPLLRSNIVWTPDKLREYLRAPKQFVPGGKMKYDGLGNVDDLNHLLAYLATLK